MGFEEEESGRELIRRRSLNLAKDVSFGGNGGKEVRKDGLGIAI